MTKIEEVARAICKAQGLDWDAQADGMTSGGGDGDEQQGYIEMAVAAIEAMREPSAAMIEAACDADIPGGRWGEPGFRESSIDEKDAPVIWCAVIDAVLAEKPI